MNEINVLIGAENIEDNREILNSIKRVFRQVLEREFTPAELLFYGSSLKNGDKTIKDIIRDLFHTEEYEDRFRQPWDQNTRVIYAIKHLLSRELDPTIDEDLVIIDDLREYSLELEHGGIINMIDDLLNHNPDLGVYQNMYTYLDDQIAFEKDCIESGQYISLQDNFQDILQFNNDGFFICADGDNNALFANRYKPLGWETFKITLKNDAGENVICNGNEVCLETYKGSFVCAERAGEDPLVVDRTAIGPFETFNIIKLNAEVEGNTIYDGDIVSFKAVNNKYVNIRDGKRLWSLSDDNQRKDSQFKINIQYLR